MPVTDQTTSNSSTGNGVTTVFPYTFKILDEADILVEADGVAKTLTTHYTVSGVGVSGGGNVTFVTAPASDAVVVLSRSMAYSRETDYQENGDLLAATLDDDVDRSVMLTQQVRQLARRAIKLPSGVTADQVSPTGNTAAERAGRIVGFDSSGDLALLAVADVDLATVSSFIETMLDDADAATARASLGILETPVIPCTSVKSGTTGTNIYALTPVGSPVDVTPALSNGYKFTFIPDSSCSGGAAQITVAGFSDAAKYIFAPDGRELASYFDITKGRAITVQYRNDLTSFTTSGFVIVDQVSTTTQAAMPHGTGKLQCDGATSISWTQEDGRGLLVWDPNLSSYRMSNFAVITNPSLFTAVNYVEGVANQALAADEIYCVYYFDPGTGNTQYLDFYRMYTGGAEAWTPIVNQVGINVKRTAIGASTPDNTRTFLGILKTVGGSVLTAFGGPITTFRCQSHHKVWRFPIMLDPQVNAGVVSGSGWVDMSAPRVEFVTTGITDTGKFEAHSVYYNDTAGCVGALRLKIVGTAFDGTAFGPIYSEPDEVTTYAINAKAGLHSFYGVALPMGHYTVSPQVSVNAGSGTFRTYMTGYVAQ